MSGADRVLCALTFAVSAFAVTWADGWNGLAAFVIGVTTVVVARGAWGLLR